MILYRILRKIREQRIKKSLEYCGENVDIFYNCEIGGANFLKLHNNIYIGPNAWIDARGGVTINSGTIIGPRVRIHSVNHRYESSTALPYDNILIAREVIIEENVWIGADVAIMPGTIIGEGSIIAASSVVTKNIPPYSIYGGNPARKLKDRDIHHYSKLKQENKIYLILKKNKDLEPILVKKNN